MLTEDSSAVLPQPARSVILIGASATGKTSVGRDLAAQLLVDFLDLDDLVEEALGASMDALVIDDHPELVPTQERLALEVLRQERLSADGGAVIALSPSVSIMPTVLGAVREARENGHLVVELYASMSEIARRTGLNAPRAVALGAPRAILARLMEQMRQIHGDVAQVSVDTVGRSTDIISQEVRNSL